MSNGAEDLVDAPSAIVDVRAKVQPEMRELVFNFFYCFSRFEYALKDARILKSKKEDQLAEADWERFTRKHQGDYRLTKNGAAMIKAAPKQQFVGPNKSLVWKDVPFAEGVSDLAKVVKLTKTIRNNLFHGGKGGDERWADEPRMRVLLPLGLAILGELAVMGELEQAYRSEY